MFQMLMLLLTLITTQFIYICQSSIQDCDYFDKQCKDKTCETDCNNLEKYLEFSQFCKSKCKDIEKKLCAEECHDRTILIDEFSFCSNCPDIKYSICPLFCNTVQSFQDKDELCFHYNCTIPRKVCDETCTPRIKVDRKSFKVCTDCYKSYNLCDRFCNSIQDVFKIQICNHGYFCNFQPVCNNICTTNSSFYNNNNFCSRYCNSYPIEVCKVNCLKPLDYASKRDFCNKGCVNAFNYCLDYCSTITSYMENRFFCIKNCHLSNYNLCKNNCSKNDTFMLNYKFCTTRCPKFPLEICNKECNTSEQIINSSDFCKNGCLLHYVSICDKKCFDGRPSKNDTSLCNICYSVTQKDVVFVN